MPVSGICEPRDCTGPANYGRLTEIYHRHPNRIVSISLKIRKIKKYLSVMFQTAGVERLHTHV